MLWATFWMAILFAAWTVNLPDCGPLNAFQIFLFDLPKVIPFFIGMGAIFERARLGALIGLGF